MDPLGIPYRLSNSDMSVMQKHKKAGMKAQEDDTVDLRAERELAKDEEVWNSYGEIGDAGLLAEWGFIAGEYAGDGLIWRPDELDNGDSERWARILADIDSAGAGEDGDEEDDGQGLISPMTGSRRLALSLAGQLSFPMFLLAYLDTIHRTPGPAPSDSDTAVLNGCKKIMEEIEIAYAAIEEAESQREKHDSAESSTRPEEADEPRSTHTATLSSTAMKSARHVLGILRRRLGGMYRKNLSIDEILQIKDVSDPLAVPARSDARRIFRRTIRIPRWP
jgi:hypothetical protein